MGSQYCYGYDVFRSDELDLILLAIQLPINGTEDTLVPLERE